MPVGLQLDHENNNALGGYGHDQYDNVSATALAASQKPDTLDASASGSPDLTHPHPYSNSLSQAQQRPLDLSSHQSSDQPPPSRQYRPESVPAHALPSQSPLYSPRSTRSHSLAASLASGSQSPIRRKPLSPTASPLAVRFSSKGFHMLPHDLPQPPESGYFSLDSPDLYGLSPSQVQSHNNSEVAASSLPTPLEAESEEE